MERYVCIHGHFYQPPRENPWLEEIEQQDSAEPYHDWNERITAECYGPNAAARIHDGQERIAALVNNYARISFNFGPTLLSWLERKAPQVYAAVQAADRESLSRFGGHGSAIAQGYNHMIMPLANLRDKKTQIAWGLRDFERRFRRRPEGFWLPETAVDLETLDLLAEAGVAYTILAPRQARAVRKIGQPAFVDVSNGRVDPSMPYRVALPSGRSIAVFFYDGPVSQGVAFEGLLHRGESLAHRLVGVFSRERTWPQLVHIATDGETYGHHHRLGEMALAYALDYIERRGLARVTNYGEFLSLHPPTHEAQIFENSSWSCIHGVERWRADCGCNSGHPGFRQAWRGPLREALDWLRDTCEALYEREGAPLFGDPWAARDAYIDVVLDRSHAQLDAFLSAQGTEAARAQPSRALMLLEMQRQLMLMYTSCGWFFDDVAGIEASQVLQYAGRAVQLARDLTGLDLTAALVERLSLARGNTAELPDGRAVFERTVTPAMVDLRKVTAHHALLAAFDEPHTRSQVYAYSVTRQRARSFEMGHVRLHLGRARVEADITHEQADALFGVLHIGDQHLHAGVKLGPEDGDDTALEADLEPLVEASDLPGVMRLLDERLGSMPFSIKALFRDEKRRLVARIAAPAIADADEALRQIYDRGASTIRFLTAHGAPLPHPLRAAAAHAIGERIEQAIEGGDVDRDRLVPLLREAQHGRIALDLPQLELALRRSLQRLAEAARAHPDQLAPLARLERSVSATRALPFAVELWQVQNAVHQLRTAALERQRARALAGEEDAATWVDTLTRLCDELRLVPAPT